LSPEILVPALVSPDIVFLVSTCVFMIAVHLFPQSAVLTEEGQSPRAETPSTVTEVDMDLDSYQIALEEVLTWLLSAEDTFQEQDDISDDVEDVKEQFATHEVNICSREPYLSRAWPDLGVGIGWGDFTVSLGSTKFCSIAKVMMLCWSYLKGLC